MRAAGQAPSPVDAYLSLARRYGSITSGHELIVAQEARVSIRIGYALDHLKTPKLILVLGRQRCGGVEAVERNVRYTVHLLPKYSDAIARAVKGGVTAEP